MAVPTSNGNNKIDATVVSAAQTEIVEVEADLAEIAELAKNNPALLGGEDVAQLLERLSSAENMADGVESKLDGVLQNLDKLLAMLDGAGQQPSADDTKDATNESKGEKGNVESDN